MKTIVVKATIGATDSRVAYSLREVGEDIYSKFYSEGIAEIPDMDTAVTELHIKVKATRHLGDVTTFLKKSLKRHNLLEIVEITREDSN
jgi:hypothetical protein